MQSKILFFTIFGMVFLQACKKETSRIINSEPENGNILISPYATNQDASGKLLILDKYGNTVAQKTTSATSWNFEKWEVDGKVRYTYIENNRGAYFISASTIIPGTGVVLDENLNEIKRVSFSPIPEEEAQTSIDSHDFIYLADNHFITISYIQMIVSNIPQSLNPVANCKVVVPVIQELLNDEVIFQWEGSKFPEFYQQSVEGNDFSNAAGVHDYMHINSIIVDPRDNNLICSFRNLNQIVKINRVTGEISWRLGGSNSDFPLTAEMKFLRQHNATLTDDNQTLLIYDNGEATERPYTRIDEFKLNETDKTITSFKSFNVRNIFSQYMGSVQKRGETYFIGCGSVPQVMEINYNTGTVNFSMTLADHSYRAFKY
jgi:arylsulfate sulfotransferase